MGQPENPDLPEVVEERRKVVDQLMEFLTGEGYRPAIVEQREDERTSLVHFKVEGRSFLGFAEEDDPEYFHLHCGYTLDDMPAEPHLLLLAANQVVRRVKGVKVSFPDDYSSVELSVEMFLTGPLTGEFFTRALTALRVGSDEFFGELKRAQSAGELPS